MAGRVCRIFQPSFLLIYILTPPSKIRRGRNIFSPSAHTRADPPFNKRATPAHDEKNFGRRACPTMRVGIGAGI